jgi:hypothetical protein
MTWIMTIVARFLLALTILILTLTQNKRSDAPLGYSTGLWMAT